MNRSGTDTPSRSAMPSKGLETIGRSSCNSRMHSMSYSLTGTGLFQSAADLPGIGIRLSGFVSVGTEILVSGSLLLHHVEIDAYLEESYGGHVSHGQSACFAGHYPGCVINHFSGRHCQSEPEVVVGTFPRVVVADSGMLVDYQSSLCELVRFEGHGDEAGLVAQPPGVKYGADLAHYVLMPERLQTFQDLFLAYP